MKRPILPRPHRPRSFGDKFGRNAVHFGSPQKHEPPPKTHLPRILLCLGGVFVLCIIAVILGRLPKVGKVSAEGGRIYSAEVMLHYADIHTGDALLGFDSGDVERQMKEYMPLISKAHVRKHLNGDVTITATEHTKLYYTCHNRNYYIFTQDDLTVLCALPNADEARRVGAVYIGLPESARVRVGKKITFVNLPYAPETQPGELSTYEVETDEPKVEYAYVFDFADTLMDSPLAARVKGMELSDRYDLWFVLDGRIRISVGDMSELEDKLESVRRALEDRDASGVDSGELPLSVDVSAPTRIVFRASPEVDIPAWGQA